MPTGASETSTGNSMAVEVPTVAFGRLPMGAELARRAQAKEQGEFSLKLPFPRTVGPVPGLWRKRSGPLPSSSEQPFGKFKRAFLETCRKLKRAHLAKACKGFFKATVEKVSSRKGHRGEPANTDDVGAGDIHQWALAVSREADQVVEGEEVVWPEPGWSTVMTCRTRRPTVTTVKAGTSEQAEVKKAALSRGPMSSTVEIPRWCTAEGCASEQTEVKEAASSHSSRSLNLNNTPIFSQSHLSEQTEKKKAAMSSDSVSVSPSPLPRSRREGGLSRIPRVRPSHSHISNAASEGPAVPSPRSNIPVPSGRPSASAQRSPEGGSASSPVGTIRHIEASQGRRGFQGTMQPELAAGLPTTAEEPSVHDSLEDPDSSESAYDGGSNTLRQRHEPAMYVSLAASRYIMGSESSSSANRALTRRTSTTFYPRVLERNSMASDGANYDSSPSSSSEELHAPQGADNQSQPSTMESPFPPLLVSMSDEPTAITFDEIVTRHPEVANTVIQTGVVRVTDQRRTLGVMDGLRQVFARNRSERRDLATFETMNSCAESPASRGSLFTLFRQPSRTPVAAADSPPIEIPAPEATSPATTMISPAAPVFTSEAVPPTEAAAKDMARVRRYLDMLAEKAAVGPEEQRAKYHQAWTSLATKFFDVDSRDARDAEVHALYTQMRAESTLHRRGLFMEMAGILSALGLDEPSE